MHHLDNLSVVIHFEDSIVTLLFRWVDASAFQIFCMIGNRIDKIAVPCRHATTDSRCKKVVSTKTAVKHVTITTSSELFTSATYIHLSLKTDSHSVHSPFLWPPYGIGQAIIFLPCGFFPSSFFYSSPNLSGRRVDVYHTSTHGVALVRM